MPSGTYVRQPRAPLPFKLKKDLTGKKYGRLTVAWPCGRDAGRNVIWLCVCDCGNLSRVRTFALGDGSTSSCGCMQKEIARATCVRVRTTHGMSNSVEYSRYHNAKGRCEDLNDINYRNYGAKGVEFRFKSFEEFYAEIGPWPGGTHEVDRIDPFGHYEEGNIRWPTKAEGANNKRGSLHLPLAEICARHAAGERVCDLARTFKTSPSYICWTLRKEREGKLCLNQA